MPKVLGFSSSIFTRFGYSWLKWAIAFFFLMRLCGVATAAPQCVEDGGTMICSAPEVGVWTVGAAWSNGPAQRFSGWRFETVLEGQNWLQAQLTPDSTCQQADPLSLGSFAPLSLSSNSPIPPTMGVFPRLDAPATWTFNRVDSPNCPAYIYGNPGVTYSGYVGKPRPVTCPAGYTNSTDNMYCVKPQVPCNCGGSGDAGNGAAGGAGQSGNGSGELGSDANPMVGNPVRVIDGAKIQRELDYRGATHFPLIFQRTYNSFSFYHPPGTPDRIVGPLGNYWHHTYDRRVFLPLRGTAVLAVLRDEEGALQYFDANGLPITNTGKPGSKLVRLSGTASQDRGWIHTTPSGVVEQYDDSGVLVCITSPSGEKLNLEYDVNGDLVTVKDDFDRRLQFTYDDQHRMQSMTDPAGGVYRYAFDGPSSIVVANDDKAENLTTVSYPDGSGKVYWYNEQGPTGSRDLKHALTGITDENGKRFATWSYDGSARVVSSEHAGGVDRYTFNWSFPGSQTIVTTPQNATVTYYFSTVKGVMKSSGMSQPAASGGVAASSAIVYDTAGNVASRTAMNGTVTTSTNDLTRNLELTRVVGSGTSVARTVTTLWHPSYRLPLQIAQPKLITSYTYDTAGNLLSEAATPTSDMTGAQGFSAPATGAARVTSYTYNGAGQVLTMTGPRTDVVDVLTYSYDAFGNRASIVNALGQTVRMDNYDANGRVGRIVWPNGSTTSLRYSLRGWLQESTTSIGDVSEKTTFSYDGAGQLLTIHQPDNSFLGYTYDDAHRLISISDSAGNLVSYSLDAAGNRVGEQRSDPGGTLYRKISRAFDVFNRLQGVTGGAQ